VAAVHDYTWQALINMGIAGLGSGALVPLSGYLTVWAVCAGASFLAAALLVAAPKQAFSNASNT